MYRQFMVVSVSTATWIPGGICKSGQWCNGLANIEAEGLDTYPGLWILMMKDGAFLTQEFFSYWHTLKSHKHQCNNVYIVILFLFQGCGGSLTTASGAFSSPNYPLPYHPSAECYWNIRTSQGSQLLLSFSDFHLESSSSCSFDYLAVSILLYSIWENYAVFKTCQEKNGAYIQ